MSTNLWTEAPMVRTFEGEVIILVMSTPAMTPASSTRDSGRTTPGRRRSGA